MHTVYGVAFRRAGRGLTTVMPAPANSRGQTGNMPPP